MTTFASAGRNECALVAIAAATAIPLEQVQQMAERICERGSINAFGTGSALTARLLGLLGRQARVVHHEGRKPLITLINDLRACGIGCALFAVRVPGTSVWHAVSIGPLGYVDLIEQVKHGGALSTDDPRWHRSTVPTWHARRSVAWHVELK